MIMGLSEAKGMDIIMNILILGGTGSIGCALIDLLKGTEWKVFVTSRTERENSENIVYLKGNAHDDSFLLKLISMNRWDAIIDFMAYSTQAFSKRLDIFLNGTDQYFFLSSSRVYAEYNGLITESSPRILDICIDQEYLQTDEYALAKARQENLLFHQNKKNWTIIRPYKTYNNNRLQLGMFEKEDWLYRLMMGGTLLFPREMSQKYTTLTHAADVAFAIKELIANHNAYGEAFHITTTEQIIWKKVIEKYIDIIQNETGQSSAIKYWDKTDDFFDIWSQYQIKYDCIYDRKFDNSKINRVTKNQIKYTSFAEGSSKCLAEFLRNPTWRSINWNLNFWMDKKTNEKIRIWNVIGFKEKLRYLKYSIKSNSNY